MEKRVFVIDDDVAIRDSLGLLLGLHGHATSFFADAATFLDVWQPEWQGCLVVDMRMPGMDGLELIDRLRERGSTMPVIVVTGHGDVASARHAFRANAVDFLQKPIDEASLLQAIEEAFARQATATERTRDMDEFERRIGALTPREREVLDLVVAGRHNREIAASLGISVRTVEVHKARILGKVGVQNVTQLVRWHIEGR